MSCHHIQASLALVVSSGCWLGRWLGLPARGSRSVASSNVSHGRNGIQDGGDREPHRPAGNPHRHRAHCKDTCRALRANFDGPVVADIDQKPDNPGVSSVDRVDWRKPGKLDASANGGWNDWEPVMLSHIGQLDRNLMNAVKNSSSVAGLHVGLEQDISSTLRFLHMMTTSGKASDIVGNAGEGEGLEVWRRLVEFDPQAKSRAAGLMQKLLAFDEFQRHRDAHARRDASLGNHTNRWKRLVALMIITFMQEPVSALQENDVSWTFVDK